MSSTPGPSFRPIPTQNKRDQKSRTNQTKWLLPRGKAAAWRRKFNRNHLNCQELLLRPAPVAGGQGGAASQGRGGSCHRIAGFRKTTWFRRRGVTPLSSDMLRSILFDDITEQRYQGLVFSTLRSLLRARLIARMPWNYVDASNLASHERRQWVKMAKGFGYEVHAVFFDVPLEVCLQRNRKRERQVKEEVIQRMAQKLKPPSFEEGFTKITVVRVKAPQQSDAASGE